MPLTGYARSMRVDITKYCDDILVAGYPKTYNGQDNAAFLVAYPEYGIITDNEMCELPLAEYNERISDFKDWIESQESGLDFDSDTIIESRIEAYWCEPETTTTTTGEVTTTTTGEVTTTTTGEVTTTTTGEVTTTTTEIL